MPQFDSKFEEKLFAERQEKLARIAALVRATNPEATELEAKYPNSFPCTATIAELRELGDPLSAEELETAPIAAAIAGRVMAHRQQGKAGFAVLQQNGVRLQIYVRKDDVGETLFELYKLLDLGDIVGVRGTLMRTRTGELTLHVKAIEGDRQTGQPALVLLTKAMLALPDKYSGLEDIETRYRRRYVDLIMNSGAQAKASEGAERTTDNGERTTENELNVRATFVKRAAILRAIRKFFDDRGYLEVETPMLQPVAGGATARPFTTHHNALDMPLYLRIAPELYLKRLVVGGLDRVYEINRNFRNEGVSPRHNPEFTMLEFYQAYANYHDLMDLTQELITFVAKEVNGTTVARFPLPQGSRAGEVVEVDLANWQKLSMREAIIQWWPDEFGVTPSFDSFRDRKSFGQVIRRSVESYIPIFREWSKDVPMDQWSNPSTDGPLVTAIRRMHRELMAGSPLQPGLLAVVMEFLSGSPLGKCISTLFEVIGENPFTAHLIQPTIIYDFPLAVSPLSKVKPDEPEWTERFEFYIGGFEVGNAFSELNDPGDQEKRFQEQVDQKKAGDEEAMGEVDADYVRALSYGLPPTAGEGIGIDRLTMILTGSRSIRDVILFPLMRPQAKTNLEKDEEGEEPHGESAE